MAVLGEVTELLRRWDVWKRVEEAPARIDVLEKKLAALEERLARAPGEACPHCGALEFRTDKTTRNADFGEMGALDRHMKYDACGYTEVRMDTGN